MPFPNPDTQFKKGHPGGPGRPKKLLVTDHLVDLLAADDSKEAREAAQKWLEHIRSGDFRYFKEMLERTEGKVPDRPPDDGDDETDDGAPDEVDRKVDRLATDGTTPEGPGGAEPA